MERFFNPDDCTGRDIREAKYVDPQWMLDATRFEIDADWRQNNWTAEDRAELEQNLRAFVEGLR